MTTTPSFSAMVVASTVLVLCSCSSDPSPAVAEPDETADSDSVPATAETNAPWVMREPPQLFDIAMLFAWGESWAGSMPSWGFNDPTAYTPVKWNTANRGHDDGPADMFVARRGSVNVDLSGSMVKAHVRIAGPKAGYFSYFIFSDPKLPLSDARAWLNNYLSELGPQNATLLDSCVEHGAYSGWRYEVKMPGKRAIWLKAMVLGTGDRRTAKLQFHLYKEDLGEPCSDCVPGLDRFGCRKRKK